MGALADIAGAWIGGKQQSKSEDQARAESRKAMDKQIALFQQVYGQQRADQMPWLQQGAQAANLLGSFYGFTPSALPSVTSSVGQPATPTTPTPQPGQSGGSFGNTLLDRLYARLHGNPLAEATASPQPAGQPQAVPSSVTTQATSAVPTGAQTATGTPAGGSPMDHFFASPDYQFRLGEGNKNITANASATGGLQSGDTLKALQTYGQNMASGEFGNYMNRLAALAGVGQTSASNVGQAAGAYGSNTGNAIGQNASNLGSSYVRNGNNWAGTTGSIAGSVGSQSTANMISNLLGGFG